MDYDDLRKLMESHDDVEINFHPHYVKILRKLADDIESGNETGIEGVVLMSHDTPGIIQYKIVTKKNK